MQFEIINGRKAVTSVFLGVILFAVSAGVLTGQGRSTSTDETIARLTDPAALNQFIRERFDIPQNVTITSTLMRPAPFPGFYETEVTTDDGKKTKTVNVFITRDARCMVLGHLFQPAGSTEADITRGLRQAASIAPAVQLTMGSFEPSVYPGLQVAKFTVRLGAKSQSAEVYVTDDFKTGIVGLVLPYRPDFVEELIKTKGSPSVGPANARVTVVEYADLQCPGCAMFQKFLHDQFLPEYGDRVRVVFKEFPLQIPAHDWSAKAAVANECAYQIQPSAFANYRNLIFTNQTKIDAKNVRARLLSLGREAGVNPTKLAACIDSKASQPRIDADRREGQKLGVTETPTLFVNGRVIVGARSADFQKMVDEALAASSQRTTSAAANR